VLSFNYKWVTTKSIKQTHAKIPSEVIDGFGGIPVGDKPGADTNYGLTKPGQIIHEVGRCVWATIRQRQL
jgi:hypothetical protein